MEILPKGYTRTAEGDTLPPLHLLAENRGKYTQYHIWGTPIEGLLVWERKLYSDKRGYIQELSKVDEVARALGRPLVIKQTTLSYNEPYGVLRGLHAEPMDKLITPLTGKVFMAIADIRFDSPTFGRYATFTLDMTNHRKPKKTIVVCIGLANSFLTMGDEEVFYMYQTSSAYQTSESKRSIRWDDPDLAIPWPITPTNMSPMDENGNKSLRELFPGKFLKQNVIPKIF